jgi:hypothetical protein
VSWAIKERDYSQRRACALIGLASKVYRYRRRSDDGVLRTRLRSLAETFAFIHPSFRFVPTPATLSAARTALFGYPNDVFSRSRLSNFS